MKTFVSAQVPLPLFLHRKLFGLGLGVFVGLEEGTDDGSYSSQGIFNKS